MRKNDLRERLADAFQRDVDLDALKPPSGRSRRGEMDSTSAYALADVALGVVGRDRADQDLSGFRSPVIKEVWIDDGDGPAVRLPLPTSYNIQNAYSVDADWTYMDPRGEPVFDPTPFATEEDQELARQDFIDHRRAISVNGRRVDPRSVITVDDYGVWTFLTPVEEEIAEPKYNPAVDNCPECEAKPGEQCIMMKAIMHGFPDETPICPRDA